MPPDERYRQQVVLLVRALPLVAQETCFALKGGSAINLFIRDMPRLSVDIDLTYLPIAAYRDSLHDIDSALRRVGERAKATLPSLLVEPGNRAGSETITKLVLRHGRTRVKVEVSPVLRGCVREPEVRSVTTTVERTFGHATMQIVSFADLYAGKIMAALSRQHPRDLFDVHGLLANEGIDDAMRTAFVVYLLSGNRPMYEVLTPTRHDLSIEFERGLAGMAVDPVGVDVLEQTRETLVSDIVGNMPDHHKRFLVSFESGEPDWTLMEVPHAKTLPAVRWRMQNLAKVSGGRRAELVRRLETSMAF